MSFINIFWSCVFSWPSQTLANFPPIMQDFFKENPGPRENTSQNRAQLKQKVLNRKDAAAHIHSLPFMYLTRQVEEEYAIWSSSAAASEAERIAHFSSPNNSFFLCVVWKYLTERETVLPLTYRYVIVIALKDLMLSFRIYFALRTLKRKNLRLRTYTLAQLTPEL